MNSYVSVEDKEVTCDEVGNFVFSASCSNISESSVDSETEESEGNAAVRACSESDNVDLNSSYENLVNLTNDNFLMCLSQTLDSVPIITGEFNGSLISENNVGSRKCERTYRPSSRNSVGSNFVSIFGLTNPNIEGKSRDVIQLNGTSFGSLLMNNSEADYAANYCINAEDLGLDFNFGISQTFDSDLESNESFGGFSDVSGSTFEGFNEKTEENLGVDSDSVSLKKSSARLLPKHSNNKPKINRTSNLASKLQSRPLDLQLVGHKSDSRTVCKVVDKIEYLDNHSPPNNPPTVSARLTRRSRATSTPATLNNCTTSTNFKSQASFKTRQNCAQSSSLSFHNPTPKKPEKKVNASHAGEWGQESEKEKLKSPQDKLWGKKHGYSKFLPNVEIKIEKEENASFSRAGKDCPSIPYKVKSLSPQPQKRRNNGSTCSEDSFEGFLDTNPQTFNKLRQDLNKTESFSNLTMKCKPDKFSRDSEKIKVKLERSSREYIGDYCDAVGCTVSWLESGLPMTEPVVINNGIVHELSEFAKKIAWEPDYVAIWILRLRSYSNVEIMDEDLKKIHLVLKRRKAMSVNLAGSNLQHRNKLASFDLGEFSLPSVEKYDNRTFHNYDRENILANDPHENTTSILPHDNNQTLGNIPLQTPKSKKYANVFDVGYKAKNNSLDQNIKMIHLEPTFSPSAAMGYPVSSNSIGNSAANNIGISSKGRIRKPTAKFQVSSSLKYLLNSSSPMDSTDYLMSSPDSENQQQNSNKTPTEHRQYVSKSFGDQPSMNNQSSVDYQSSVNHQSSIDYQSSIDNSQNNLSQPLSSDGNPFAIKVLHPIFEEDGNEIGKHCQSGKIDIKLLNSYDKATSPITNGIVYELYHFFRKQKASLTSLVHTLYRLNGVKIDKSHIITTMAKIHEMVKVVWEEQIKMYPCMPYVKFDMPESQPNTEPAIDLVPDYEISKLPIPKNINKRILSIESDQQNKKSKIDVKSLAKNVTASTSKNIIREDFGNGIAVHSEKKSSTYKKTFHKINEDVKSLKANANKKADAGGKIPPMPIDSENQKRTFDLYLTKGCEGKITRGDIVYLYTRWLRKKMECRGDVFVTDLSKDVENLISERKVGSLRIPVGTLMSSSVKLFEEFRKLSKINMLDAKTYLLDDWMEDITYIVNSQNRHNTIDGNNEDEDNSHTSVDSNNLSLFDNDNAEADNSTEELENSDLVCKTNGNSKQINDNNRLLSEKLSSQEPILNDESENYKCLSPTDQAHGNSLNGPLSNRQQTKEENLLNSKQNNDEKNHIEDGDVEKIVGYRLVKIGDISATEYRVRWTGFSAEEESWVNEHDLNCPDTLSIFWKALKKQRALKHISEENQKSQTSLPGKNKMANFIPNPKGQENFYPFFGGESETSPRFFELMIKNLKPSLVNYQYGEQGIFPRKGKVSKGEVLDIYDDWRKRNKEQLISGGNRKIDLNLLITRIKILMDEKRVRNFNPSCVIDVCYRMSLMKAKLKDKEKINEYLSGDFMEIMEDSRKHQDFVRTENSDKLKEMNKELSSVSSSNDNFDNVEFKINMLHNLERESLLIAKYIKNNKTNINFERNLESEISLMKKLLRTEELPRQILTNKSVDTLRKSNPSVVKELEACGVDDDTLNELIKIALKNS